MKRHPVTQQEPETNSGHSTNAADEGSTGPAPRVGGCLMCGHCAATGERVARPDDAAQLKGENNVLAGILRDAGAVIETIVPENDDEAERLFGLRVAIAHAVDPYKREGTLL